MKYVVVLGDGMADRPIAELGDQTPLAYAETPTMDQLAAVSEIGMVHTIPDGMKPGSDTANLSVLGYNPRIYYSGRSPLEALSIGVDMKDTDIALRCNLVTLSEEEENYESYEEEEEENDDNDNNNNINNSNIRQRNNKYENYEDRTIIDHSSGEISTADAAVLLDAVREGLENETYKFYVGTSYRHLLIWDRGDVVELTQPHDVLGQTIGQYLPEDAILREMMKKSYDILVNHPINVERKKKGLNPANSCWFWGAGTKPALSSFAEKTHLKGAMISAVDLLKGIAVGASMKVVEVEGANGGLNTNYEGKAQAAIDVLTKEGYDFAYIHVEAPDEMGHQGSVERKVKAIEYLDSRIIKPVKEGLEAADEDFRMLVLPDHPTPICMRTHSSDSVPYLLYDSTDLQQHDWKYNEAEGESSGNYVACGHEIIDYLFGRKTC